MSSFVEIIHISTLIMMIVASFLAVVFKKLLPSVVALAVASLLLALEFYILHAPDVAIAEAAIGAGLTMAIFIFAIRGTSD
ncbi:MAG: hydrogenase subunit MbhD domain-containing protein [Candidatus Caldatribacteriota bacterium]|nr:hydrogenase subunit MbhD domain-containing protein [Candidatus Caldatribacteriota bacterium]